MRVRCRRQPRPTFWVLPFNPYSRPASPPSALIARDDTSLPPWRREPSPYPPPARAPGNATGSSPAADDPGRRAPDPFAARDNRSPKPIPIPRPPGFAGFEIGIDRFEKGRQRIIHRHIMRGPVRLQPQGHQNSIAHSRLFEFDHATIVFNQGVTALQEKAPVLARRLADPRPGFQLDLHKQPPLPRVFQPQRQICSFPRRRKIRHKDRRRTSQLERRFSVTPVPVSYTHLRAHETRHDL